MWPACSPQGSIIGNCWLPGGGRAAVSQAMLTSGFHGLELCWVCGFFGARPFYHHQPPALRSVVAQHQQKGTQLIFPFCVPGPGPVRLLQERGSFPSSSLTFGTRLPPVRVCAARAAPAASQTPLPFSTSCPWTSTDQELRAPTGWSLCF